MTSKASEWFMLTPAGVLHAFMKEAPGETELALQALLTGERALDAEAWLSVRLSPGLLRRKQFRRDGCRCCSVLCKVRMPNWMIFCST